MRYEGGLCDIQSLAFPPGRIASQRPKGVQRLSQPLALAVIANRLSCLMSTQQETKS